MSLIGFHKILILSIFIDNNHVKTTNIIPIIPIIILNSEVIDAITNVFKHILSGYDMTIIMVIINSHQ